MPGFLKPYRLEPRLISAFWLPPPLSLPVTLPLTYAYALTFTMNVQIRHLVRNQLFVPGKPKRVRNSNGTCPKPKNFASSAKKRYAPRRGMHTSSMPLLLNLGDELTITTTIDDLSQVGELSMEYHTNETPNPARTTWMRDTISLRSFCKELIAGETSRGDIQAPAGTSLAAKRLLSLLEHTLRDYIEVTGELDEAIEEWSKLHVEQDSDAPHSNSDLYDRFEEAALLTFIRAEQDDLSCADMLSLINIFKMKHPLK